MTKNIYRFKGNFKSGLFISAIILTLGFFSYTQFLVKDLQEQSREYVHFKVKVLEQSINNDEIDDFSFFFENVIEVADYPIIYTDKDLTPQFWRNVGIPEINRRPLNSDTLTILKNLVQEYSELNDSIPISFQGEILGFCFYGESAIILQLRLLPIIEIFVVTLFILIGYAGFNSIKKSEERFIWVGMAKETAHQLGTPLSSQMGWLEYLKATPDQVSKVIPELEKDVERLQVITNRFSQIGSMPDMKSENLGEIINKIVQYFSRRIPQKNSRTRLQINMVHEVNKVKLNEELFSWVLENLIKNGLDALENNGGIIKVDVGKLSNSQIYIDVTDTGKGIRKADKKNVFKPGYSTKKRGWGLGLSFAKRIIEDYHGGKLILRESNIGEGSTFRVVLREDNGRT